MNTLLNKSLSLALATLALCNGAASAADTDLGSQRSEKRVVKSVDGRKLRHDDWVINPTPQSVKLNKSQTLARARAVVPYVRTGAAAATKAGVKPLSGAYRLVVDKKGIAIVAYDKRGEFYGRQTLRQLLDSPCAADGSLPYIDINDWPNLPMRGVVEGFYGTPWSHDVRLSLIDYYGRNKLNTYIYGPKDDPYHSCPNWRLPYPQAEADKIRQLAEASRRNHVDFVWAVHPGQDIKWNDEDYNNLVRKFNMMYDLGVRHFAIFFDDISGEGTDPARQVELLNRLNSEFIHATPGVGPLTVCPTDYTKLWAKPGPDGPLAIYGKSLDPDIRVFWTGDVVCSDLTPSTLQFVDSRIKRPAFYWWNFPVSDYCRNYLLLGPVYGLDTSVSPEQTCGIVSNPMEHGEASKTALYSVADYAWNTSAFNPLDSWERAIVDLVPEAAKPYRTLAIHTADTQTGYRRDESWETPTFRLAQWDDSAASALQAEFQRIEQVPGDIRSKCTDTLLLKEIDPWLTEFGHLGTRGRKAIDLGRNWRQGMTDAQFWNTYAATLMTPDQRKAYDAHKSGTMKLQPFYDNMTDDLGAAFMQRLFGQGATACRGISSYSNADTNQPKLMLDSDSTTYYTSGVSQRGGDWIGLDLLSERPVSEIVVLQGRNSTDDSDFYDNACIEYSTDGSNWTTLLSDIKNTYNIHWAHTAPVLARYVRLRRLDSKRTNWAAVRTFQVNPPHTDSREALLFDRNISSALTLATGSVRCDIAPGSQSLTLLAGAVTAPLHIATLDARGTVLTVTTVVAPYTRIALPAATAAIELSGTGRVYEAIVE